MLQFIWTAKTWWPWLFSSCSVFLIDQREIPKVWQRKLLISLDGLIFGIAAQAYNWVREREREGEREWITSWLLWDKYVVRSPPFWQDLKDTPGPASTGSGEQERKAGIFLIFIKITTGDSNHRYTLSFVLAVGRISPGADPGTSVLANLVYLEGISEAPAREWENDTEKCKSASKGRFMKQVTTQAPRA